MKKTRITSLLAGAICVLALTPGAAMAGTLPSPAVDAASCMGSGSSFYGTFAPRQRAFVAAFVIQQASSTDDTAGATYRVFAQEKEGGTIPAPCGTRIE